MHSAFEIQLMVHPSVCKGLELPKQLSGLYWGLRRRSSGIQLQLYVLLSSTAYHSAALPSCKEKEQLSVMKRPRGYLDVRHPGQPEIYEAFGGVMAAKVRWLQRLPRISEDAVPVCVSLIQISCLMDSCKLEINRLH